MVSHAAKACLEWHKDASVALLRHAETLDVHSRKDADVAASKNKRFRHTAPLSSEGAYQTEVTFFVGGILLQGEDI